LNHSAAPKLIDAADSRARLWIIEITDPSGELTAVIGDTIGTIQRASRYSKATVPGRQWRAILKDLPPKKFR